VSAVLHDAWSDNSFRAIGGASVNIQ